jgi:hypothetical protein
VAVGLRSPAFNLMMWFYVLIRVLLPLVSGCVCFIICLALLKGSIITSIDVVESRVQIFAGYNDLPCLPLSPCETERFDESSDRSSWSDDSEEYTLLYDSEPISPEVDMTLWSL